MAINFCVECLKTTVTSNKVCADGFEAQNLLTNNSNNGFRVEYFVKPPIEILFTFAFPIDVHKIVCGLKVDERRTTALQCLVANESKDFKLCGYFETLRDNICVTNTKYLDSRQLKNFTTDVRLSEQNCELFYVSRINQKYFVNVLHVKLRLLKTENSEISVLKYVKVFGKPNASVATDSNVLDLIRLYWEKIAVCSNLPSARENKQKRKVSEEEEVLANKRKAADTPLEFLDPITNEVMLLPLILPSGNTVDKSTLDKYIKNESLWGRPPNDPFTNIPFKSNSEPLPNTALKLRIDTYFTENHETIPLESLPKSRIIGGYGNTSKLISSPDTRCVDKKCVACDLIHGGNEAVYKLPCGHLICQQLHNEKYKIFQKSCLICLRQYCPKLVVRYFNSAFFVPVNHISIH